MEPRPGEALEVLVAEAAIRSRVGEMGRQITEDYRGRSLLMVGILRGCFVFMADLARAIDLPLAIDFMAISSYGASTRSSGVVRILKDLDEEVEGKHILVVEDIVDTGLTLSYIRGHLAGRGAASVAVSALLDKPSRRTAEVTVEYRGFQIPDAFVVGYGLDFDEHYRNLRDVCRLITPAEQVAR